MRFVGEKSGILSGEGAWVDVLETSEGGAVIKPQVEMLDFLDGVFAKSVLEAEARGEFKVVVLNENEVKIIDKEGNPMPFETVMKVLFD